jgi:hypothetical protein
MAYARRRRGRGGLILGLVVVLALGWVGYWYGARYVAGMALERVERAPVAGARLGCAGSRIAGFPISVDITCRTITVAAVAGGLNAELGGLAASAPLYRPGYVSATLTSPLTLNAPVDGLALTLSWSLGQAQGSVALGGLKSVQSSFLSLEADTVGLPVARASARAATASAHPAGSGNYVFAVGAEGLVLERRNGQTLPAVDLQIQVEALAIGKSLGANPHATLLNWLRRGGTAEVQRARIKAGGAVIEVDGSLSITSQGVLSGALNMRFANPDALIELAETLRPGSRDNVAAGLSLLTAMTVPVDTPDGPARQTSLVINDGLVAVGIIPIGVLPALRF